MQPIRHLKRSWCSFPGSLCIGSCSVTTDDFNPGMNGEPGLQGLGLAVRQYLYNAMSLQVNQECAIGLPLADGPIIYSKDTWGRSLGHGRTAKQAQEGMSTDRHLHVFALTSRRAASQFFGDSTEPASLSVRATRMGRAIAS